MRMAAGRLAVARSTGALRSFARKASLIEAGASLNIRRTSLRTSSGQSTFRNEKKPTELDKKVLLWTRRFRKEEDIPPFLSVEVLKAAQSQLRIRICYVMMALTLLGCLAMVVSGKMAAKRDDTLLRMNMEKKAKWRAEGQQEEGVEAVKAE